MIMNIRDTPKMFDSAPWTTVAIGSIPMFGVFVSLLIFGIMQHGVRVVAIVAVTCGVIAILAITLVDTTLNLGLGENQFVAAAKYDYGVSVMSGDGKESRNFNVDGYISIVYSRVSQDGDITLHDAHTDYELPR